MTFLDINTKVDKIMKNPHVNFFIIMNLIVIISCYSMLNDYNKNLIGYFFSNSYITLASIVIIIIIGYFNINIAILALVLLFIAIYTRPYNYDNHNSFEGFTDKIIVNTFEDIKTEKEKIIQKNKINKEKEKKLVKDKIKQNNDNNIENKVKSLTSIITDKLYAPKLNADNEYKQGLLENKQTLLAKEKNNNTGKKNNLFHKKTKNKENFQTIELRSFNPSNEIDTNLLITKEILQDMINRIEYNYETIPYLKKYLRHRLEEIIDVNNLLKDEEED